ncbi:MAG: phenylacetate-CoA oxygenase subunit PaaI [Chloroflexi bacterium]|nr:phenylacetate-CoA oxygenase subunit PaaI [Chloroflexota bacterium]
MSDRFEGKVEAKDFPQMDKEYQDLLIRLFRIQSDAEIGGPHLYVDRWLLKAPLADDMWRVARVAAEEIDHFRKFNNLLHELGYSADDRLHAPMDERMIDVFRHPMDTWLDFAMFSFLIDRVGRYQLEEFIGCSYLPVTRILDRIIQEEKGHVAFGEQKIKEMAQTIEGKAVVQDALNKYYIWALDMFGKSKSSRNDRYLYWRIKRRHNEQARVEYINEVDPLIKEFGLQVPDPRAGRLFL